MAYSPALGYAQVDPEVAAAVGGAVTALESAGARVTQADPGFADPIDAFRVLWYAGAAQLVNDIPPGRRALIDPGLAEVAAAGRRYSALDYLQALRERSALGIAMGAFHQAHDLLVTPAEPIVAFEAGAEVPGGSAGAALDELDPVHVPVQHDAPAGGHRALRVLRGRAARSACRSSVPATPTPWSCRPARRSRPRCPGATGGRSDRTRRLTR